MESLGKNGLPYSVNGASELKETNSAVDETGKNCDRKQFNPNIWFLAGTFGGKAERKCTIPATTAIFFPLIMHEVSFAEDRPIDRGGIAGQD